MSYRQQQENEEEYQQRFEPWISLQMHPELCLQKIEKKDGCWNWKGRIDKGGYGQLDIANQTVLAHRAAFFVFNGFLFTDMCVLHDCDNPSCCNPDHLKLGTHADNMEDMKDKGRRKGIGFGEKNGRSKLNQQLAEAIRTERNAGRLLKDIASEFGVSISTINRVCNMENWNG